MKMSRIISLALLIISATAFLGAQAEHPTKKEHPAKTEHPAKGHSIIDVATDAGHFDTLVAAIKAAGLVEKLQGEGPFTVFAPTDEAFAKLPEGTLENLLKPANKAQLAGLLACHVVPGKIMSGDLETMKATNVNGQDLHIKVADSGVTVDGAKVIKADIAASNGVIHVIDTVIVPAPPKKDPAAEKPKDHPGH